MCVAKLYMRIVVGASNSSDPDLAVLGNSSSSSYDGSAAGSVSRLMLLRTLQRLVAETLTPLLTLNRQQKKVSPSWRPKEGNIKVEFIDMGEASSSAPPVTFLDGSDHYPTDYANR